MTTGDSGTEAATQAARRIEELKALLSAKQVELERERAERKRLEALLSDDEESGTQRVEQALRESEERFRLLARHTGDAVFMLDPEGRVMTWTPAAERTLGFTEQDALGLSANEFFLPQDRVDDRLRSQLEACLTSGRSEVQGWRLAKHGRKLWAHVVTCPIRGPDGELRGYAQIVRDGTLLKEVETLLAERTNELERSNRALETFASVAAHDLQEPLRKLRTFGDRLQGRFAHSLDEDASALVDRMSDAAKRMQLLIDGLLTYARLKPERQSLTPVDLGQVAREVVGDLSTAVEKSEAKFEIGTLPAVSVDPTQMRQMFQNLFSNALKFARPGVKPIIKVGSRELRGHLCEIYIEDNGIGFEPRYAERIFGLFQRLHGRGQYEGSGLGLGICRRIAEHHGGTITALGKPGEGAVFKLRLPLPESEES